MPVSRNRKGHSSKVAYRKQAQRERTNKYEKMHAKFLEMIKDKNASMTEMLNKEDAASLPGGPDQTLGKLEPPNGLPNGRPWNDQLPKPLLKGSPLMISDIKYEVVKATERDPSEPIIIHEPFHVVGTPEEEAEQKRILESAETTSISFGQML